MNKSGRLTDDHKIYRVGFRLSEKDIKKLTYCSEKTGVNKTEIVRKGINSIYNELED